MRFSAHYCGISATLTTKGGELKFHMKVRGRGSGALSKHTKKNKSVRINIEEFSALAVSSCQEACSSDSCTLTRPFWSLSTSPLIFYCNGCACEFSPAT